MVRHRRPQAWYCPRCTASATTVDDKIPYHACPRLAGLVFALVSRGESAKVERVERQDYIGNEDVQFDAEGRPTMSVVTTRDDGQDCVVYAPTAGIGMDEVK